MHDKKGKYPPEKRGKRDDPAQHDGKKTPPKELKEPEPKKGKH